MTTGDRLDLISSVSGVSALTHLLNIEEVVVGGDHLVPYGSLSLSIDTGPMSIDIEKKVLEVNIEKKVLEIDIETEDIDI